MKFKLPAALNGKPCTVEISFSIVDGASLVVTPGKGGAPFVLEASSPALLELYQKMKSSGALG